MSLIIARNFKRANALDSIASDAQFKVGDRVKVDAKYSSNVNGGVGIVSDIKNGDVVVEFTGHGKVRVPALYVQSADSSFAADAQFKVGDRVRLAGTVSPALGKTGVVVKVDREWGDVTVKTDNGKTYQFEASAVQKVADSRATDVSDAAGDAAEFHVGQRVRAKDPAYEYSDGKALGAGMFTVKEVRNNGDVRLDDDGDVWISPSLLVEANDAI